MASKYGYVVLSPSRGGRWIVRDGVSDKEQRVNGSNWFSSKRAAAAHAAKKNAKRK